MRIDRRDLICGLGVLIVPSTASAARALSPSPGATIALWPGAPPGGGGPDGPVTVDGRGALRNIAVPALEIFEPSRPNGAAVLVAAGGGYKRVEMEAEARPAARWLAARGITSFVLRYRLPGEGWRAGALAPLQDAQRALRLIRSRRGIDGVGVLGFSSGGHLMGLAAARSAFVSYDPVDATDAVSARPDEAALIYPVVTLEPPFNHTSTRVQLVGHHPSPEASARWSVQTHVRSHCSPMFLVQAEDDPISDIANTALLEQACLQAGVPVERHVLPSGGHGFGMGKPGTPSAAWPGWYEAWLHRQGVPT